jgi:hypothetical protein
MSRGDRRCRKSESRQHFLAASTINLLDLTRITTRQKRKLMVSQLEIGCERDANARIASCWVWFILSGLAAIAQEPGTVPACMVETSDASAGGNLAKDDEGLCKGISTSYLCPAKNSS